MCVQWVVCVQSVYTVYTQRHVRGRARPTRAARAAVLPGYTVPDTCALWYSVPVQIHQNFVMRACMNHRARAPLPRARERNRLHEFFVCISSMNGPCTIIVDQNSVVSVSGMRVGEACWITNIGRIDDFRTSMDSGRTPL